MSFIELTILTVFDNLDSPEYLINFCIVLYLIKRDIYKRIQTYKNREACSKFCSIFIRDTLMQQNILTCKTCI